MATTFITSQSGWYRVPTPPPGSPLPMLDVILGEDGSWLYYFLTTGADYYRVVLWGMTVDYTGSSPYACPVPGFEGFPAPLEFMEVTNPAPSEVNPCILKMQWYKVNGANYYDVQELISGNWSSVYQNQDPTRWVTEVDTPVLADETTHTYQVAAVGDSDVSGAGLEFVINVVTPPELDETIFSITYTGGNVVVTHA